MHKYVNTSVNIFLFFQYITFFGIFILILLAISHFPHSQIILLHISFSYLISFAISFIKIAELLATFTNISYLLASYQSFRYFAAIWNVCIPTYVYMYAWEYNYIFIFTHLFCLVLKQKIVAVGNIKYFI